MIYTTTNVNRLSVGCDIEEVAEKLKARISTCHPLSTSHFVLGVISTSRGNPNPVELARAAIAKATGEKS